MRIPSEIQKRVNKLFTKYMRTANVKNYTKNGRYYSEYQMTPEASKRFWKEFRNVLKKGIKR